MQYGILTLQFNRKNKVKDLSTYSTSKTTVSMKRNKVYEPLSKSFSCWLSHFQGGLGAFPSPSFSSAGNQNLPDYVLNLLGGEGNHFQLRGGNDSSSEAELIPFASQVIPFVRQTFASTVCIPPRITETLKFPYKLYSH